MPKTDQEKTKLMNYAKINEQVKRALTCKGPDGHKFPSKHISSTSDYLKMAFGQIQDFQNKVSMISSTIQMKNITQKTSN